MNILSAIDRGLPSSSSAVDHGGLATPSPNSSSSAFSTLLGGAGSGISAAAAAALPTFAGSLAMPMDGLGGSVSPAGGALPMTGGSLAQSPSAFGQAPASGGLMPSSGELPMTEGSLAPNPSAFGQAPASGGLMPSSGELPMPGGSLAPSPSAFGQAPASGGLMPSFGELSAPASTAAPGAAGAPPASTKPSADDKRPAGDDRSAKEIIDDNPTLKNLGNQSHVKDNLKKQVGDFENDPDAAYRASKVLDYVKQSKNADGDERSDEVKDNGKIEGFTKDGDARHGTEAGLLQDFGKDGYSALKDDHQLDATKDGHVKKDGTNMDNLTYAGHEVAQGISNIAGAFSDALDSLPGPLKSFLGPLHMAASGISGGANVADAAMTGGDVGQAGKDMASGMLTTGSNIAQGVGELASDTIGQIPGVGRGVSAAFEIGSANISGGLDFANAAVQGGDLEQAGKAWGGNVAGTAAGVGVGMVDPTGIASGAAQSAVTNAINPATTGTMDPAMQGAASPAMQGATDPILAQGPVVA